MVVAPGFIEAVDLEVTVVTEASTEATVELEHSGVLAETREYTEASGGIFQAYLFRPETVPRTIWRNKPNPGSGPALPQHAKQWRCPNEDWFWKSWRCCRGSDRRSNGVASLCSGRIYSWFKLSGRAHPCARDKL